MPNDMNVEVVEANENASAQDVNTAERTFTQAELDDIVKNRVKRALSKQEKEFQAKVDEAEKLRQMNVEQKSQYEKEKSEKIIAELTAKLERQALEKEASKMLMEHKIVATDELLGVLVRDNAENTKSCVNTFVSLVTEIVDDKVKEALKGKTPNKFANEITKKDFSQMSVSERNELFRTDRELYLKMKG